MLHYFCFYKVNVSQQAHYPPTTYCVHVCITILYFAQFLNMQIILNNGKELSITPVYTLVSSNVTLFHFCDTLNAYVTYTWKTMHLAKFQHLDLPHYLALTSTFRQVGLIFANISQMVQRPIIRDYHLSSSSLIRDFAQFKDDVSRPTPRPPFFKPSFVGTCVDDECVKSEVECSPTLKFVTQATMGVTPWWFRLRS